jgi:hypothetical protein
MPWRCDFEQSEEPSYFQASLNSKQEGRVVCPRYWFGKVQSLGSSWVFRFSQHDRMI